MGAPQATPLAVGPFAPGDGVACLILESQATLPDLPQSEAARLAPMVPARQREFAWGRAAARQALVALGAQAAALPPDPDRVPIWPLGIAGSISHSGPLCAAAVRRGAASVGLDIEIGDGLDPDLWDAVLTRSEMTDLHGLPAGARAARALVHFTAKEAAYKAHFPRHRQMFDFRDLCVCVQGDSFTAHFPDRAGPPWAPIAGRWMRGAGWTASGVVLP